MADIYLTYILALMNGFLVLSVFFIFRKPVISIVNLFGLLTMLSFTLRPILSANHGYFLMYSASNSLLLNKALLAHLISLIAFYLGYLSGRPHSILKTFRPRFNRVSLRIFGVSIALSSCAFAAMVLWSGKGFFAPFRQTVVTLSVPGGKYLFGLITIPLSLTFMFGYLGYHGVTKKKKVLIWLGCLFAASLITLAYQRGFLVYGLLFVLLAVEKTGKLNRRIILGILIAGIGIVFFMRPLVNFAVISSWQTYTGHPSFNFSFQGMVINKLLYSANFDKPDVLTVGLRYLNDKGPTGGTNLLASMFRFLPFGLRTNLGLSGPDILNLYQQGTRYLSKGFGFNVRFPVEMLMSFGWPGLFFCVLPGWISGLADRWIARMQPTPMNMVVASALLFSGGFMGAMGSVLQWLIAYLVVGYFIRKMASIRFVNLAPLSGTKGGWG